MYIYILILLNKKTDKCVTDVINVPQLSELDKS